jgi:hypothetical protein
MSIEQQHQQATDQTTIRVTREQRHALGILAAAQGVGVGEIVQQAMTEYLVEPSRVRIVRAVTEATDGRNDGLNHLCAPTGGAR